MTKRNQVLRVPQKKYSDDFADAAPVLGLPHENLIPAVIPKKTSTQEDAVTGITALAGDTSITNTGDTYANIKETASQNSHTQSSSKASQRSSDSTREDAAYTGITGSTSVSKAGSASTLSGLKGRTRDVWEFFCRYASETGSNRVRVSRRQIQKESGVGSLNTIDSAIGLLQGRGYLRVHPLPGSNNGYEYEVLTENGEEKLAETPKLIAETLRQAALVLEQKTVLSSEQLNKWSRLAHQSSRLVEELSSTLSD